MASYKKYSKKDRQRKDSDTFKNPQNFETNNVNTNQKLGFESVREKWIPLLSYWRFYPDRFLDYISVENPKIKLYFFQRVYLRILIRYRKVFLTATRGTSKSFLANLAFVLKCIFYPNNKLVICAPGKEQATGITIACLDDIFDFYPLLENEYKKYIKNKDYTSITTYNKSRYDVVQLRDSSRGKRSFGLLSEEIGDEKFEKDIFNAVILPLMAGNRITGCGKVDPYEVHKTELYITTASPKQLFAYEKVCEIDKEMLDGKSAFVLFNGYELPAMHGRVDLEVVQEKIDSPTYSTLDFMREFESIYTGSSTDALVSDDKLRKSRIIKTVEHEHCGNENVEYILMYDVARSQRQQSALSCLIVIKLILKSNGDYIKDMVNIFSMIGEHDTKQALFLKEKVKLFKPSVLVIDANGLGTGVVDQLVLDLNDGNPPYAVLNDKDYEQYHLPDSIPMVYALKSQNKETPDGQMNGNIMKVFNKLGINLLSTPNEGLLELKRRKKINMKDSEAVADAEIPFYLTNNLCEEILNLKYKQVGHDTRIEQISRSIPKDKFSALKYGLYWIYLQERKNKIQKKEHNLMNYIFY